MTAFDRIEQVWMPAWLERFRSKSADYNSVATAKVPAFQPHEVLGIRGQFADIWRKVWKLKKALWDGQTLVGEQPREIIEDLISHLFLTLDLLDKTERQQPGTFREPAATIRETVGHGFDGCPACLRDTEPPS